MTVFLVTDKEGRTALHHAVKHEYFSLENIHIESAIKIVMSLLQKGTDINERDDSKGYTALHYAARGGPNSALLISTLIQAGAHINAQTLIGQTSFMLAAGYKADHP